MSIPFSHLLLSMVLELTSLYDRASVFELDEVSPNGKSCLVEFVKFGEAERACKAINGREYNNTQLACSVTEPSR